jgi:hypothetical protein
MGHGSRSMEGAWMVAAQTVAVMEAAAGML